MPARTYLFAMLIAFAALLAAACGGDEEERPLSVLHFLNWEDYVDPAILEGFEAEYGIEVVIHTFDDEPELVSRLTSPDAGQFDLFVASGTVLGELAESRLLAELNQDRVSNLSNIDPTFLDQAWDPGNRYSAPYDWGTTGIVYNTNHVSPDELSWSLLSEPEIAPHAALDSDFSVVIGLALVATGHPIDSTDPGALDEAVALIQEQVRNGIRFEDAYSIRVQMTEGELWAAQAFNGDAVAAMADNADLDFFIPSEGADIYFDTFGIPRDAKNKIGAELFINYILRPEVHAAATAYTGYQNPNAEAARTGLLELDEDGVQQLVHESTDRLQAWTIFDDEEYSAWNRAWSEVQSAQASSASR
jgi:spermidine/putrescine transport system substrate-binding protein